MEYFDKKQLKCKQSIKDLQEVYEYQYAVVKGVQNMYQDREKYFKSFFYDAQL